MGPEGRPFVEISDLLVNVRRGWPRGTRVPVPVLDVFRHGTVMLRNPRAHYTDVTDNDRFAKRFEGVELATVVAGRGGNEGSIDLGWEYTCRGSIAVSGNN
ncbi:hypothetical protein A4X09_0g7431 [Tilletia walkeri]|uniref:Uncharacterized protein n=1 Tax=Tilletia walkeri TaxID=117179 RepID=A0A8X7N1X5_9BASI|nr:hypothetical protein A4X09_0g7431 [Tilletia walkeri]